MKTSFLALLLALMLLISGGGYTVYGRSNPRNSVYATVGTDIVVLKKLEQFLVKETQKADKLKMGSLSVYQKDIVKGIEQRHPNYIKITNLGELPCLVTDYGEIGKGASATSSKHYLLEVQDKDDVFYYGVSVVSILRAPSDVIPAHVSEISILVKPIETAELLELLKSLQEK